ncbi:MAG: ferredoxin domain-containing protein [Bacteroidetes bacterium]|nr:ferredoxin domain-containing protein [Bacteroidota bacterium]MBU1719199.1 ferredoxin domain-containing protein [Bacteroidota bacterium]
MNIGDMGIAIGSAAAMASHYHLDNRIMFSVGRAVVALKLLGEDVTIAYGLPLAVGSKNPFFDRSAI